MPGEARVRTDGKEGVNGMGKVKFRQKTRVLSGREARRYGEREQRREERQRQIDAFWALSPEKRARRMADNEAFRRINKNGITLEDLKNVEDRGIKDGFARGAEETMLACYAAVSLTLHELHGFGHEECMAVLKGADEKVVYALNTQELLDQMRDELGIEFHLRDGLDEERIVEV